MIIFLYGPDAYRRNKKIREIVEAYRLKHTSFSSDIFDLEEKEGLPRLKGFMENQSLFEDFKLAILKGLYDFKPRKDVLKFLTDWKESKNNIILVVAEDLPPEDFIFLTKKPCISQNFKLLSKQEFSGFLKNEATARSLILSGEAESFLSQRLKNDTWSAVNLLDQILLYKVGQKDKKISLEDIKCLFNELMPEKAFDLVLGFKNASSKKQKLFLLEKLFLQNEAPAYLFNLLGSLASALTARLADYDCSIKSGGLEYEEALLDLALS